MGARSGRKPVNGTHVDRHVCGGAPLDADGNLRDTINDCPFPPTWVVVTFMLGQAGEPIPTIVLGCDLHSPAILKALATWGDAESTMRVEIDALPAVLSEFGPDVHVLEPTAA